MPGYGTLTAHPGGPNTHLGAQQLGAQLHLPGVGALRLLALLRLALPTFLVRITTLLVVLHIALFVAVPIAPADVLLLLLLVFPAVRPVIPPRRPPRRPPSRRDSCLLLAPDLHAQQGYLHDHALPKLLGLGQRLQ